MCYLRVPFELASPPRFHVTHIPKGNQPFMSEYQYTFLHIGDPFSSGRGSFLALCAAGCAGGRLYYRRKFGPRPGSVARALGAKSRDLASNREISFRPAEPRRTMESPPFFFAPLLLLLLYRVCITPSLKLSSSLLCGSQGTTAVTHQALPAVTATDGASVCACVPCCLSTWEIGINTYSQETCN